MQPVDIGQKDYIDPGDNIDLAAGGPSAS